MTAMKMMICESAYNNDPYMVVIMQTNEAACRFGQAVAEWYLH